MTSLAAQALFGSHPAQVCFEWNTARHAADYEGRPQRRALTEAELQRLFDDADERTEMARRSGRKGWLAAMRDSTWASCMPCSQRPLNS